MSIRILSFSFLIRITCLILSLGNVLFAQQDSSIVNKFQKYQINNLQEKIYLHLDRTTYLVGETIWFKIYCVDAVTNKPIELSKVAYLEVLDGSNKPVLQTKVELSSGFGDGQLLLNPDFISGNYSVRVYTNWMKNFDPSFYFQSPITIINSFRNLGLTSKKDSLKYDLQFFPEGGNLVYNFETKVAFRGTKNGLGFDFSGFILNQNNDTIVKFFPKVFGNGSFKFTPIKGMNYHGFLQEGKKNSEFSLPNIYDEGYVLNVSNVDSSIIKLAIKSSTKLNETVLILVHTRGVIKKKILAFLKNGSSELELEKSSLGDGISQITLFNSLNIPVCERLVFKLPSKEIFDNLKTDKNQYFTREKVKIDFPFKLSERANLSISVTQIDSISAGSTMDIKSYLLLSSDLKGKVEYPEYYFKNYSSELIDNLMLTHGWRRFKWEDVLSSTYTKIRFIPEYRDHIVFAEIIDSISNNFAENVETYLASPNKYGRVHLSKSDKKGQVKFELKDIYGSKEFILQTHSLNGRKYKVDVKNPFSSQFEKFQLSNFDVSNKFASVILDRSIAMQASNIYKPIKINQINTIIDTIPFYAPVDVTYNLDDYTRFKTMLEVVKEYVTPIITKKRRDKLHFSLIDTRVKNNVIDDPLVLLDGVPIINLDSLMEINPLKVKKIDIVAQKYFFGPLIYNGIVSFSSYDGDMASYPIDKNWTVIDYEGLQLKKEFYSPKYETEAEIKSRMPDMRNLLYWNPNVNLDGNKSQSIEFYSSDLQGKYLVAVQGLTETGIPFSQKAYFKVVK